MITSVAKKLLPISLSFTLISAAALKDPKPLPGVHILAGDCLTPVETWVSSNGSCNMGVDNVCSYEPGALPHVLAPNENIVLPLNRDGFGTSYKIIPAGHDGPLQFEITCNMHGCYYDVSMIDGNGGGKKGNPFQDVNVMVAPINPKHEAMAICKAVKCEKGKHCKGVYWKPDDDAEGMRWCPPSVEAFFVHICMPDKKFRSSH